MRRTVLSLAAVLAITTTAQAQTPRLYTVTTQDNKIRRIDPTTGVTLSLASFTGCTGVKGVALATDPTTGLLWAMLSGNLSTTSRLVRINPLNGQCTDVGPSTDKFAGIAFDSTGKLYGVSGDGGIIDESLFSISKTTAQATFLKQLGLGGDGEALTFNPFDGMLYHASGSGGINEPTIGTILEKIDPVTLQTTLITLSGPNISGISALGRLDANTLIGSTYGAEYVTISTSGVITSLGGTDHIVKGFAFAPGPGSFTNYGAACLGGGNFSPTLAGAGVPNPGNSVILNVANATGGSPALLLFGIGTGSLAVSPGAAGVVLPERRGLRRRHVRATRRAADESATG
jgi:hypothetical protein